LLDVDELLERLDAYLQGYVLKKDPGGKIKKIKVSEPLVNDVGRQEILQVVRKRIDQVLHATSILDLEFIREEVFYFNVNLIQLVSLNARRWDLKVEHFGELIDSIVVSVECVYRKALNGVLLNRIFGIPIKEEKKTWLPF
jgi:hypothetical protein